MAKYDIEAIRKRLKETTGRAADPDEFQFPKPDGKPRTYRCYVLPSLLAGEPCKGGVASRDGGDLYFVKYGLHWCGGKPTPCPRLYNDEDCELCNMGFDLMKDEKDKTVRSNIAKVWLSQQLFAVNLYFPNDEKNPPELRDVVKYHKAQKKVQDILEACVYRTDGGDIADPMAYGCFWNPEAAYLFQFELIVQGKYYDPAKSRFLAILGQHPIAKTAGGQPDEAKIASILAQRHDLYKKLDVPNPAHLRKLMDQMTTAGNAGSEGNGAHHEIDVTTEDHVERATSQTAAIAAAEAPVRTAPVQTAAPATMVAQQPAPATQVTQQPASTPPVTPAAQPAAVTAPAAAQVTQPAAAPVAPAAAMSPDDDSIDNLIARMQAGK